MDIIEQIAKATAEVNAAHRAWSEFSNQFTEVAQRYQLLTNHKGWKSAVDWRLDRDEPLWLNKLQFDWQDGWDYDTHTLQVPVEFLCDEETFTVDYLKAEAEKKKRAVVEKETAQELQERVIYERLRKKFDPWK